MKSLYIKRERMRMNLNLKFKWKESVGILKEKVTIHFGTLVS
jgi:hypothetical protein